MSKIIIIYIAFLLALYLNVTAERKYEIYETSTGNKLSINEWAEKSLKYDVIFFGEFHDDSLIHQLQYEYLSALYKLNTKIAVSMEMFERDAQNAINDYLNGKITEEEFLKKSRPWPDYKKFYKPLVELAKSNNAPVIAADVPRKYAALYATEGMDGINKLSKDERAMVAEKMNIREDEYQKNFYKTMYMNLGVDTNSSLSPNQENTLYLYYGAQCLKDETMAESIINFLFYSAHSDYKVIHFNGDFHSNDYLGTVQKVWDRRKDLKIAVITPQYVDDGKNPEFDKSDKSHCDFLIVLQDKPKEPIPQRMMGGHLGENYIASHKINVVLNPSQHYLEGIDTFKFKNPVLKKCEIKLLKDLKIESITSPNCKIDYEINPIKDDSLYQSIILTGNGKEFFELVMTYNGTVYHSPNILLLNQRHSNTPGIISDEKGEGIYLPGGSYYPQTESDLASFDVKVTTPKELTIITSGTLVSSNTFGDNITYNYKTEIPTDDVILVGGRYVSIDSVYDGKKFSVYTFGKNSTSTTYLNASIEYYKLYSKLLGAYPYKNFSVVENFFATGFGMPEYTLLSNVLMKMPWILLNPGSLAHEFVHNWWGNSVYVNFNLGNWCEALTTFCANYYYNVLTNKEDAALDWRKKALLSLESLPEKTNYPVIKFKYQQNNDDAAIGYQKGAFIFYEVYKLLGEKRFFQALKNFAVRLRGRRTQWFVIFAMFKEQIMKDSLDIPIDKVMDQWLNETKIPIISLKNVSNDNDSLRFDIDEDLDYYMSVPVKFITEKGSELKYFTIQNKTNKFAVKLDDKIKSIQVDPAYQCLRHLNKWEIPFSFEKILSDNPLLILPSKSSPDYKVTVNFADLVKESDYKVDYKSCDDLKDNDWSNRSLIVLGDEKSNSFFKKLKNHYPEKIDINENDLVLEGKKFSEEGNTLLLNMQHPTNPEKFASIIYCGKIENTEQFRRLFHYLSYSMVFLGKSRMGRPLSQMEIFPAIKDKSQLQYDFAK